MQVFDVCREVDTISYSNLQKTWSIKGGTFVSMFDVEQ